MKHLLTLIITFNYFLVNQTTYSQSFELPTSIALFEVELQTPINIDAFNDQKLINEMFYNAVDDSARFQLVNFELSKHKTKTATGKLEMSRQYELDGFGKLALRVQDRVLISSFELTSPEGRVYIQESLTTPWGKIDDSSIETVRELIKNLIYRSVNRLPIDTKVLSIQGNYVTLSGGSRLGVSIGETYSVHKIEVLDHHPVNKSWLSYNQSQVGEIVIVDVNPKTSVGKITSQSLTGIIPGVGFKVASSPARAYFATQPKETFESPAPALAKVMTPEYSAAEKNQIALASKPKPKKTNPQPIPEPVAETQEDDSNKTIGEDNITKAEEQAPQPPEAENFAIKQLKKLFSSYTLTGSLQTVSTSSPATSSSQIPFWILNHVRASTEGLMFDMINTEIGGSIVLGATSKGNYYGFGADGRFLYPLDVKSLGFKSAGVGAYSEIRSRVFDSDVFGGMDNVLVGASASMTGVFDMDSDSFVYDINLDYIIMGMGSLGYSGVKHTLSGANGYQFEVKIMSDDSRSSWNWGGGFLKRSVNYAATSTITMDETAIMIHAKSYL